MRTTKGAVIALLLAVMLLGTRQLALGQSEVATPESFVTVDRTAHGTKVPGTLTIYYDSELTTSCDIGVAATFFFMRVTMGKDLFFPFSGDLSGKDICLDNTSGQQTAIEEFIKEEVIPEIFPDTPAAPFALKSVKQFVQGVTEPLFVMIDFVIAVQEK
jgi:hypothetical protein